MKILLFWFLFYFLSYPVVIKKEILFLLTAIFVFVLPSAVFADATDSADSADSESNIEIEYFTTGASKSNIGNAQTSTTGLLLETEYENNDISFSFNYERWNYNWTNPGSLPFVSGSARVPWSTFTTLQFGFAYEDEINDKWELNYYIEAESSYEKEKSKSNEYEAGVDFIYEASDEWTFTINANYEYLDAEGAEIGVDLEIEWNHDKKDGWSAEFEISSEFPETSLTYHFTREFSTTLFYNESGTNTIRLSDSSPVIGMQGGYFEDEYNSLGIQVNYEFARESYLSFALQQNSGRIFSFTNSTGGETEITYEFSDVIEASIGLLYTF